MQKVFRITVDISKKIPAPAFEVNTNDLKSVKLEITITNGQSLLDLTDVTPRINIRKPDNEVIFQDCEIVDATTGKVQIVLENQAYLVPGTHTAEIACYKGNEITAITGTFSYKSIKGIMNDEAVESKSEFTAINRTLNEAERILEDLRENGGGAGVDQQARQKIEGLTEQLADTVKEVNGVKPTNGKVTLPIPEVDTSNLATKAELQSVASGAPKAVSRASEMTDSTKNYVYTGNETGYTPGNWYYWNGTAWAAGGVYQSTGIANDSITPNKIRKDSSEIIGDNLATGKLIVGKYVDGFGIERSYAEGITHGTTDYLPVTPGVKLRYWTYTTNTANIGSIYDSTKKYIKQLDAPTTVPSGVEMTMPNNAAYVRVNFNGGQVNSFYVQEVLNGKVQLGWLEVKESNLNSALLDKVNAPVSESDLAEELKTKINNANSVKSFQNSDIFYNKVSSYIGDSITAGLGTSGVEYRYAPRTINALKMSSTYYNNGVSGSTVAKLEGRTSSFVERVLNFSTTSQEQITFILGGVNDFVNNVPVTTLSEAQAYKRTNGTYNLYEFYGAYCEMVEALKTKRPNTKLILMTPITEKDQETANTQGKKLVDYVNAVKTVANNYNLVLIDLFNTLPIDATNSTHRELYIPDGIHPNDEGNRLISERIVRFINFEYAIQLNQILQKQITG